MSFSPRRMGNRRVILYVLGSWPKLCWQQDRSSVQLGQVGVEPELWCDLDRPSVRIDCDQPPVKQRVQVASKQQASFEVMLRILAVEVKMRCFQRSGRLRAGECTGFAVLPEHGLAEALLAESGLAEADAVAARDPSVLPHLSAPPGLAGHQIRFKDRAQ